MKEFYKLNASLTPISEAYPFLMQIALILGVTFFVECNNIVSDLNIASLVKFGLTRKYTLQKKFDYKLETRWLL